jgi:hypothetical protein
VVEGPERTGVEGREDEEAEVWFRSSEKPPRKRELKKAYRWSIIKVSW